MKTDRNESERARASDRQTHTCTHTHTHIHTHMYTNMRTHEEEGVTRWFRAGGSRRKTALAAAF